MFCPRCATENKKEQGYCRQCGLTLLTVRLAMEGRVDEAIKKLKKSETILVWGFLLLLLGALNAGANAFFHAWQPAIFSGAIGFVAGIILILIGLAKLGRANKALKISEKEAEPDVSSFDRPVDAKAALPAAPITEELLQSPLRPHSVVEDATIRLKERR